jgi:tetratricopeptide (TPR) repeat protein
MMPDKSSAPWGMIEQATDGKHQWSGMTGFLERQGMRFGGVLSRKQNTVEQMELSASAAHRPASEADFFALSFSPGANADGLDYKVQELVSALKFIKATTRSEKVTIVAHSAGGLVARAYLQDVVEDRPYGKDVDRLITISTPHQGAAIADVADSAATQLKRFVAEWLGPTPRRIKSLAPSDSTIRRMNDDLTLPSDVYYASIVVRGIHPYYHFGSGKAYDEYLDRQSMGSMPSDFRDGGDQLIHVRSQNLRLAACARKYEAASKNVVQYAVARVGRQPDQRYIHSVGPDDRGVQEWVAYFLTNDGNCWTGKMSTLERQLLIERHASQSVFGLLEKHVTRQGRHDLSHVIAIDDARHEFASRDGDSSFYRFTAKACWKGKRLGVFDGQTRLSGTVRIRSDQFGRVLDCALSDIADDYDIESASRRLEPIQHPASAKQFLARAKYHYDRKMYAWASSDYQEASRLDPSSREAKDGLARAAALAPHMSPEAEQAAKLYSRGLDLAELNKWTEAEDAYRKAIKLDSRQANYWGALAVACANQTKLREAEESCRTGLRLAPDNYQHHSVLAYILLLQNKDSEGESSLRDALRLNPKDYISLCGLGALLAKREKWRDAEVAYRASLRMKPDYGQAHNGLGDAAFAQENWEEAEASYRQAARAEPKNGLYRANLAGALLKQERRAEARRSAEEAVRLGIKASDHWAIRELGF